MRTRTTISCSTSHGSTVPSTAPSRESRLLSQNKPCTLTTSQLSRRHSTANLIKLKLGVDEKWVKALPLDETVDIDGIKVTLIDANQ